MGGTSETGVRVEDRFKVGAVWRDTVPGRPTALSPEMVTLPPGRFFMGAPTREEGSEGRERPRHEVRIDHVVALGKFAVMSLEWAAAVGAGVEVRSAAGLDRRDRFPARSVSWEDAQAYLSWLNSLLELEGRPDAYRLPSEAEWEYACRAGTRTAFSVGATISPSEASCSVTLEGARPVPAGSYPANAFGLHDMHGAVWEWCGDWWNPSYHGRGRPDDGSAWTAGDSRFRVLRGGSYMDRPESLRSAARRRLEPDKRVFVVGFRLARTL